MFMPSGLAKFSKSNAGGDKAISEMKTLPELDWNFDNVPGGELVACCYWEYARESAFIRNVRQQCLQNWKAGGWWDQQLHADLQKVQSIGYPSDVILRGVFFAPDDQHRIDKPDAAPVTNCFPQPWQSLTANERAFRARIRSDRTTIPLLPFERAHWTEAREIAKWAESRAKQIFSAFDEVRKANPEASEVTLIEQGKLQPFPGIHPSLFWESGKEFTVVAIDWGSFTNDEIVNYFRRWVKVNRPSQYPVPSRRGHKPGDWRAQLTRLAVMRLMSRFTPLDIIDPRWDRCPAVLKTKTFSGRKWEDDTKWHDARREAGRVFRQLFPFLPKAELPLSWKR
jgi:hypothetical protein